MSARVFSAEQEVASSERLIVTRKPLPTKALVKFLSQIANEIPDDPHIELRTLDDDDSRRRLNLRLASESLEAPLFDAFTEEELLQRIQRDIPILGRERHILLANPYLTKPTRRGEQYEGLRPVLRNGLNPGSVRQLQGDYRLTDEQLAIGETIRTAAAEHGIVHESRALYPVDLTLLYVGAEADPDAVIEMRHAVWRAFPKGPLPVLLGPAQSPDAGFDFSVQPTT